jgi:hypothetical protein
MAIGETLRDEIVADATLLALVGTRVHPLVFPYNVTFPCITYRIISGALVPTITATPTYVTRVQYDVWSREYDDTNEVKDALLTLFFLLGDGNPIISTAVDLNFDLFEKGTKLYRSVVDIRVRHEGS